MGYPTDEDFAEAHGWNPDRPRFSEADRKRELRNLKIKKRRKTNKTRLNRVSARRASNKISDGALLSK